MRISIRLLLALVLSSIVGAHAQELLTTDDGISLRGTVRLLQSNAATCNVLQANEPSYEEMRVNQDQPLHLWELEFSVFNGSGRALDHLIAYYDTASPWPPCTNWTENYQLGAEYDFIQVQWVGPSGRIQHTGSATPTLPNQTHTETILLLAFNGVRPQFTDWSVNYTFMEGEALAPAVTPAIRQQTASDPEAPCVGDPVELKLTCTEIMRLDGSWIDADDSLRETRFVNGERHGWTTQRRFTDNMIYAMELHEHNELLTLCWISEGDCSCLEHMDEFPAEMQRQVLAAAINAECGGL